MWPNKNVLRPGGLFCDRSSQVIARTPPQTKKKCLVVEQLFGMYNICIYHIAFKLCVSKKKEKIERKKINTIKVFVFGFLTLRKVSKIYGVQIYENMYQ